MGRIISGLAVVTLVLTQIFGYYLFKITGSREIFAGAIVEILLCAWAYGLANSGNIPKAIVVTFFLHSLSTLYFGLILSPNARVQVMAIFLLGLVFLLFGGIKRWLAIGFILAVTAAIEANNHIHFFRKVELQNAHVDIIGYLIIGTVMFLTSLMFYIFVKEIEDYRFKVNMYTKELQRTKQAISKYVRENSHQVRIDLNIIYGYLQHLSAEVPEKDSPGAVNVRTRDLHAMLNSTKAINEFINNSLEWSRIEQGLEIPIKKETIDFELWLDGISERFKLMAREKSVDLLLQMSNLPLYIVEDKNRLEIILGNLLSNAIKFTGRNTVVLLSVNVQNEVLVIGVSDQGPGIPIDQAEEVFKPFVSESGTGIGLPVARQLAKSLSGDIFVDPYSDVGATFILTLPLVTATNAQAQEMKKTVNNSTRSLRVLVVDDDDASRRIALINLQRLDYQIYTCASFDACKNILLNKNVDLVLLDYQLSNSITAVEVIKWIRSTGLTKNLPIIVLSGEAYLYGHSENDAKSVSLAAGANGYILKPIDYKSLSVEIEKVVNPANIKFYPWER